jgi:hypothetical protein
MLRARSHLGETIQEILDEADYRELKPVGVSITSKAAASSAGAVTSL